MGLPSQQSAGSGHHWHGIEVVGIQLSLVPGDTVSDNQRLEYEYVYKTTSSDQIWFTHDADLLWYMQRYPTRCSMPLSSDDNASGFQLVPPFFDAVQMCQTHDRDHFARQHAQLLHQKLHSSS